MLRDVNLEPKEFAAFISAVDSAPALREFIGITPKVTREDLAEERTRLLKELLVEAGSRFPIAKLKSAEIKEVRGKMKELIGYSAVIKYIDRSSEPKQMKKDFTRQKLNSGTPADWLKMAIEARLELLRIIR